MERIKEALNKARIERRNSSHQGESNDFVADSVDGFYIGAHRDKTVFDQSSQSLLYPIQYLKSISHPVDAGFLKEKRIITENDQSSAARAYSLLRTKVLQKLEENNWNSLAVVSANKRSEPSATRRRTSSPSSSVDTNPITTAIERPFGGGYLYAAEFPLRYVWK